VLTSRKDLKKPSPKKTKPKQVTRFDQAANAAQKTTVPTDGEQPFLYSGVRGETCCPTCNHWNSSRDSPGVLRPPPASTSLFGTPGSNDSDEGRPHFAPLPPTSCANSFNLVDFFQDTPWGHVPPHRLANITMEPSLWKGGLLGGSAKPSKLAQLAAARKRKEEEKQASTESSQSGRSISLLDQLSTNKENARSSSKPQNLVTATTETPKARFPTRAKSATNPVPEVPSEPFKSPPPTQEVVSEPFPDLRAKPSMFAQTMFGQRAPVLGGVPLQGMDEMDLDPPATHQEGSMFTLPYTSDPEFAARNPFSGPSPDDVVLRAQSKGSARV
jgi:elongation factor 1 alpha-like protein